ncbi:MAG: HtaA domain-containing protein, partial [Kibdelosporangium sp.]
MNTSNVRSAEPRWSRRLITAHVTCEQSRPVPDRVRWIWVLKVPSGLTGELGLPPIGVLVTQADGPNTSKDLVIPLSFKGIGETELSLAADQVVQGGTLSFTGKGFAPVDLVLGSVKADASGAIKGGVVVPAETAVGEHELVATGTQSRRTAKVKFTVTGQSCVVDQVDKGNLLWGFKKSFRQYVGNGRGNSITGSGGAVVTDIDAPVNPNGGTTGAHRYPFGSAAFTSVSEFEVSFGGTITFDYPGHLFTISLSRPKVTVEDKVGLLHADVELKSRPGAPAQPVKLTGVELAKLDLAKAVTDNKDGTLTVSGVTATLASAEAFGGFYGAGEQLDDLTVTLGADCSTLPPAPGPGTPPPLVEGGDLVPPLAFRPQQRLADTGVDAGVLLHVAVSLLLTGAVLRLAVR